MAKSITAVEAKLEDQLRVAVSARHHHIILDEPKDFGSSDEGMTPIEALLGALGACKCIVARSFAKKFGVVFSDLSIKIEGELDTDGFMGLNPEAKIGLSEVKTTYHFVSESAPDKIAALVEFVDKTCPVADSMMNTPALESVVTIK